MGAEMVLFGTVAGLPVLLVFLLWELRGMAQLAAAADKRATAADQWLASVPLDDIEYCAFCSRNSPHRTAVLAWVRAGGGD
jgi:hypothetical protein